MHATHQFFLTQRSLYLLVLAGRAGGEDTEAEYWLQLVESFAGESPVIVVLNKISEHPFDLNRRALRQKYPSIREFVRIDCKDGQGLDELHAAIRREVDRLDGLRTKFPGPWFKIKDYLASMAERGENFLSYEDYAQLCAKHGETDAAAQSQLAGYLHSLGIALNFKDDPRLQDTHVLSPHWVTNGIYKILNWPELEARKGIMKRADLMGLLDNKAYPRDKHGFLLDLMKKFDTCFEFPDDRECRFFVPELLDKQEPVQTGQFDCADTLEFEYHYNYIPEGLLPRFIVRTHALSEGRPRWRTGVILKFEENEAMVKADTQARKVHISVAGKHEGRRRLLAVIRSDFERIHNDIKKLEVTEMVPVPGRSDECVSYVELCVFEQKNVRKMPRVIGTEIVKLDVKALLNGVDIEGSRRRPALQTAESPVRIFISYSHKDENLRAELETHLKLLQRENKIATWTDRRILGGGRWAKEISRNLELADMILLLVSSDFVASDYCYDNEMKRAIARGNANNVTLIPIIVRACDWKSAPFGSFQGFPENGRAVTLWEDRDNAWTDVVLGIRRAIDTRPKVGWRSRKLRERGE
ncbi:MAG: internalin [Chthoniobacter sp.]|nr:internalin [Chthoniobacter sp.]